MGETTHISWADRTWSPWTGCTKISPACDGCYAAHLMDTRMHRVEWGEPGAGEGTRSLMSDAYWRKPLAWAAEARRTGVRPWVFPSLCDPFDTAVEPAWRRRFVDLMWDTPEVVWLLLTKRIGNVHKLTDPLRGERPLPPNHALLATVVTQQEADRDLRKLIEAAWITTPLFTGVSVEPMLESLDIAWALSRNRAEIAAGFQRRGQFSPGLETLRPIDWVICGGETDQGAHKARPLHPDWVRDLRDDCAAAGVPFHLKQWGEWAPGECSTREQKRTQQGAWWFNDDWRIEEITPGWAAEMHCDDEPDVWRLGKRDAGRHLDGVIHDARPEVR